MRSLTYKPLVHMVTIATLVFVQNWVVHHRGNEHHDAALADHNHGHDFSGEAHFESHGHAHHDQTPHPSPPQGHASTALLGHAPSGVPGHTHEDHPPHPSHDHELSPIRLGKASIAASPSLLGVFRDIVIHLPPPDPDECWPRYTKKSPLRSGHRHQDQPRAPPFLFAV